MITSGDAKLATGRADSADSAITGACAWLASIKVGSTVGQVHFTSPFPSTLIPTHIHSLQSLS